jgi:hypothetical protein
MTHTPSPMNTKKRNWKYANMYMALPTDSVLFWIRCHHSMARPEVADRGNIRHTYIWRAAANILTKQSRIADKGWSSILKGWA